MSIRWFAGPVPGLAVVNPVTGAWMPGDTGTVWDAETGGTVLTDLVDADGEAIPGGALFADAHGYVRRFGIDTTPETEVVYIDFTGGLGARVRLECLDRATFAEQRAVAAGGSASDPTVAGFINNPASSTRAALTRTAGKPVGQGELMFNVLDYTSASVAFGTDCQASILAACTAASAAGGGVVYFPYRAAGYLSSTFSVPAGVALRGDNRVLLKRVGTAGSFFINATSASKFSMRGLTIDPAGLATVANVRLGTGVSVARFKDCAFTDSGITPVGTIDALTGVSDVKVKDCDFYNTPRLIGDGTVTFTDAGDLVTTPLAHGLVPGNVVQFATVVTTTGILANTYYFVRKTPSPTTLTLSAGKALVGTGAVTLTASSNAVGLTAHKVPANTAVEFTTVTGGAPLVAGTTYYVKTVLDADSFTLSATPGGAVIDLTTDGTATELSRVDGLASTLPLTGNGTGTGMVKANPLTNVIKFAGTASKIKVQDCTFTGWRERCVYLAGTATEAASDVRITGCDMGGLVPGGSARQPIAIQGNDAKLHRNVKILHNTVEGAGTPYDDAYAIGAADLISVHRTDGVTVAGNTVRDGGDVGITVARASKNGTIENNTIIRSDSAAISVGSDATGGGASNITVTGNTLLNNGQARDGVPPAWARNGVNLNQAVNVFVGGNTIGDDQGTPTQNHAVYATASQATIGANHTFGNAVSTYGNDGASDLKFAAAELRATVAVDQVLNTTTNPGGGLVDVAGMSWAVAANATYELVNCRLTYNSGNPTPDMDIKWAGPGSSTFEWTEDAPGGGSTSSGAPQLSRTHRTIGTTVTLGGMGANTDARPTGTLKTGSTPGTFKLQFAQTGGAAATDTIIRAGSVGYLRRVA